MNGYQNPNYKTWDEWAKAAGVYGQFSAQQLALAEADPDYGWGTTSNKVGYAAAATPEQRAVYHQQQTELNRTKGFTGGGDGSLYDLSPTQQAQNAAREAVNGYGPFDYSRAPDYRGAMDKVLNYGAFSYDPETDPVYSSYRKTYAREGRRASEDTMGQYAAMTGGRPSTAAMTAAQQAGNYYSAQMADKIPELYQQAYQRYLQEYQRQLQALDALNADRSFEYGVYGDRLGQLRDQYNLAAGENADAIARTQNAEQTAYQRKIYDDETNYAREQDRLDRERQARLDAITEQDQAWQDAQRRAQYGDYSGLRALGIDVDAWLASQQSAGGYGPGGSNPPAEETESPVTEKTPYGSNTRPDYLSYLNDLVTTPYGGSQDVHIRNAMREGASPEDIMLSKQFDQGDIGYDSVGNTAPGATDTGGAQTGTADAAKSVTNSISGGRVFVDGTGYTWDELARAVAEDEVKATYNSHTGKWTYTKVKKPNKEGGTVRVEDFQY
jgi:hypothetical protein